MVLPSDSHERCRPRLRAGAGGPGTGSAFRSGRCRTGSRACGCPGSRRRAARLRSCRPSPVSRARVAVDGAALRDGAQAVRKASVRAQVRVVLIIMASSCLAKPAHDTDGSRGPLKPDVDGAAACVTLSCPSSDRRIIAMNGEHRYLVRVEWTGNTGSGTSDYKSYSRNHLIQAEGKPDIPGASDPRFAATGRAGIRKTCWSGRCRPATSSGICTCAPSRACACCRTATRPRD